MNKEIKEKLINSLKDVDASNIKSVDKAFVDIMSLTTGDFMEILMYTKQFDDATQNKKSPMVRFLLSGLIFSALAIIHNNNTDICLQELDEVTKSVRDSFINFDKQEVTEHGGK